MTPAEPSVAVLGAGGHGRVLVATLQEAGRPVDVVYDDDAAKWSNPVLGVPVRGPLTESLSRSPGWAIVGIGDNLTRKAIAEKLALPWATAQHPRAYVHGSVAPEEGSVVFAGACIQPGSTVGPHVIVNTGVLVDHDTHLGAYAHCGTGARLAGGVHVGEGTLIGAGATLRPGVRVGAWSVVGAGAVVVKDVPDRVTVVGVPARSMGVRP